MSFSYGGISLERGGNRESDECEVLTSGRKGKRKADHEVPGFVPGDDDGIEEGAATEKVYMRVPNDPVPYEGYEKSEGASEGVCFPSQFVPDIPEDYDDMASEDVRTAYDKILKMVKDNYANNMVTKDLVNNIHSFYEENIRGNYPDMPIWSKRSIYNFIFFNSESVDAEERQANESIKAIYHHIDFLRSRSVYKTGETGRLVPDHKNIKLMCDLAKTHAQLVAAKKQRRK
jgi:hypothetical protein